MFILTTRNATNEFSKSEGLLPNATDWRKKSEVGAFN
jgi:hypothetical protein